MRNKQFMLSLLAVAVFLLSACASSDTGPAGIRYPPTEQVEPIFQISHAPGSCRVFAHLFATMPATMAMSDFAGRISEEAKSRGADMMLIGRSRQCTTESSLSFTDYGPDREYTVAEWPGWSFGFKEWGKQGDWASIGYNEWMDSEIHYDYPVVMQVVLLRCRE